ncbi:MAG: hypothetical protein ABW006_09000 [Hyphomicrobium sp.]
MRTFLTFVIAAFITFLAAYNIFAASADTQGGGRTSAWAEITGMGDQ